MENEKIEKLKKVLTKASSIEKGKEIGLAHEFVSLDEKIEKVSTEIDGKLLEIKEELKKKLEEELSYEINPDDIRGEKGDKGDKGDNGEDGINGKDGKNGLNGKDGKDGNDGLDGIDGKDGVDGKDGSPDTAKEIKEKLETLKKDDRLDKSAIKGLDNVIDQKGLDFALGVLDQRTKFLINKIPANSGVGDVSNFELELARKITGNSYRDEPTITDGHITEVIYWTNSSMTTKLFTKSLTWTDGKPTEIITTDEVTGKILTTTLDWSGTYPTVTKVIS